MASFSPRPHMFCFTFFFPLPTPLWQRLQLSTQVPFSLLHYQKNHDLVGAVRGLAKELHLPAALEDPSCDYILANVSRNYGVGLLERLPSKPAHLAGRYTFLLVSSVFPLPEMGWWDLKWPFCDWRKFEEDIHTLNMVRKRAWLSNEANILTLRTPPQNFCDERITSPKLIPCFFCYL